jgi:putative thioredoxin
MTMSQNFIVDVTETDFEYEVINYSLNTPVVVDFWASWCQPCKILSPILEQLAVEGHGYFRLARVNVDKNPNLALQFGVRTLPTIKAFVQSQVIAEFVGAQPETRVREFLTHLAPPSPISLAIEKAQSILAEHEWNTAEAEFREILDQDPMQIDAVLGLMMALLGQGKSDEALPVLRNFPASKQYTQADKLLPLAAALENFRHKQLVIENDLDIAFENCIRMASRGNILAALDGLLEILKQDKRYRDNIARQVFLSLLELLGDASPEARQYRSELAMALF